MTAFFLGYVHALLVVMFVALLGWVAQLIRTHWHRSIVGRHLMRFSVSMTIWFGLLAGTAYHIFPLWVYALGITPLTVDTLTRNWLIATGGEGTMPGLAEWIAQRRKGIAAFVAFAAVTAQQLLPLSPAVHGWLAFTAALAGFIATYAIPNAPATKPAADEWHGEPPPAVNP